MKVRYRRRAQFDIENIHDYIAERSPRAATEVVARIPMLLIGWSSYRIWDISAVWTYEWVVVGLPYIIVYEIDETAEEVAIIAVFHGAQDRDDGI
jgi:toxin ParE1/3/4